MTLGYDDFRTNEFQQRRRLRLQQVREQSKDIAKKIRQRARVEKIRHVLEVDAKKEKDYFECQDKLVKRLEQLYSQGVENLGLAHKDVFENTQGELIKEDLSKLRGKEAAAILKKKKQDKLNEQKKLLDRKLKAREVANELSREKSTTVVKALEKSSKNTEGLLSTANNDQDCPKDKSECIKNDMATQWEIEELPKEWEPAIPSISIPNCDSVKDSVNVETEKSNRSKKIDLFALSDEMTLNINRGHTENTEQRPTIKPSLTLISEYLQNRSLRLRQNEPSARKKPDDLQSIKQTILRTRATKRDGSVFDSVCHVLDEQVIPVPSWQAEANIDRCYYCKRYDNISICPHTSFAKSCNKGCLSSQANSNFLKSPMQFQNRSPVSNSNSNKAEFCHGTCAKTVLGNQEREKENNLNKKSSVTVYNHNTKDTRDIPCAEERLVSRDPKSDDDAYAQAIKETSVINTMEQEQLKKMQQDLRNKVAVQKQSVDKEYKETLEFLNSIPKDKGRPIKSTYINEKKEKLQKESHQRKLQEEFRKIEKENNRHNCKHSRRRSTISDRSKSKSPVHFADERENEQYSWMPVPESDGSLAIHTVPNITKHKSGNIVKFSQINSYHEYRSRHKHTPPTKDSQEKKEKRVVETVVLEQNESSDYNDSTPSERNSIDDSNIDQAECTKKATDVRFLDADRIIIYKILDSKKKKKGNAKVGMINKASKRMTSNIDRQDSIEKEDLNINENSEYIQNGVSYDHLQEGVYKATSSKGDNMASMYFSESPERQNNVELSKKGNDQACSCKNIHNDNNQSGTQKKEQDKNVLETLNSIDHKCCTSSNTNMNKDQLHQASTATSTSSFKTASNVKGSNAIPDEGFVKFIDEAEKGNGKFYIGASGFLKDDNFEVLIQLRKKDSDSVEKLTNKIVPGSSRKISNSVGITEKGMQAQDELIVTDERKSQPLGDADTNKESVPSEQLLNNKSSNSQNVTLDNENQNNCNLFVKSTDTESVIMTELPNVCEKGVHTSFQETYAIPDYVPKSDPMSRPATSTYTQTTFSSPIPRPAFMHMSSSTAYMSPPELILPRFLKHDYIVTSEEMYDSGNISHPQDENCVISKRYSNHDESCKCKHCHFASKTDTERTNFSKKCCKRKLRSMATKTPPNTARSQYVNEKTSERNKCKKTKCQKCASRSETKLCSKSNKEDQKYIGSAKSTGDIPHENLKSTINNKYFNVQFNSQCKRSQLDPVTKEYINKLLSLKQEGLKAIEIINQDCSTVTTPASSIINVTSNIDGHKPVSEKISLEQIKALLKRKILRDYIRDNINKNSEASLSENLTVPLTKKYPSLPKKRTVHKVKSLNISKRMMKAKKLRSCHVPTSAVNKTKSSVSSTKDESSLEFNNVIEMKKRSKSSPTPRSNNEAYTDISSKSDPTRTVSKIRDLTKFGIGHKKEDTNMSVKNKYKDRSKRRNININGAAKTTTSSDSEKSVLISDVGPSQIPITITTQTNGIVINNEINYMKIAEDKLQNMEKIADLTDKCTKRLSNLAKVLEQVRRNKSLVYSQISSSDSTPDTEGKSDMKLCNGLFSLPSSEDIFSRGIEIAKTDNVATASEEINQKDTYDNSASDFVPLLINIPKPNLSNSAMGSSSISNEKNNIESIKNDHANGRYRGKPPAALSRIHLKQGMDAFVTPHELSTVIEVDSPMSIRTKNQSSHDSRFDFAEKNNIDIHSRRNSDRNCEAVDVVSKAHSNQHFQFKNNPLMTTSDTSTTDSSCNSKMQMMDMRQFNDIMLKPFISIQEYAKQCNIGVEESSNIDEMLKENPLIDDLNSFNSDSSLPDVIGELLKRNVISEPFKFDTGSNNNSTALSSESTLSVLALSKVYKKKMISKALLKHRDNLAETSDTMSISSNPDLENAFQKLGMGWASSTLKKTKERLALTSSSSTSSSSLAKFKIRSFNQKMPDISTDSVSSLPNLNNGDGKKITQNRNLSDAVQQTSLSNSMTVKEFLTNELSKKITFTNKSHSKEAEVEFFSLYETKMPEEMKNTRIEREDDQSIGSVTSANNNRARTSTPVQIFKSTTYRSSSSSNTSNGLFSNADDLSSVKVTSTSIRNHSTSDKEDLTIPSYSLKVKKTLSDHQSD